LERPLSGVRFSERGELLLAASFQLIETNGGQLLHLIVGQFIQATQNRCSLRFVCH
jgi:hypothetical protein